MLRALVLVSVFFAMVGCATTPPPPVVWYIISPTPTPDYPHGNIYAALWTWERVREFQTANECQDALMKVHNEIHRPVDCIASNDRRMAPM